MLRIKKSRSGFTLIELLIVVAIIGVLSSALIISLNGAKAKAVNTKVLNDFVVASKTATMCATENWNVMLPQSDQAICNSSSVSGRWPVLSPDAQRLGWYYSASCNAGNDFVVALDNINNNWKLTCNDGGCVKTGGW